MFLTALYFIPCFVSLLWAFSFLLKARNQRQTFYLTMLAVEVFYYVATAVYLLPSTDYELMVRMDALCVPVVFVLPVMMALYIYLLQPGKKLKLSHMLWLFPAVIFGTLVCLMYFILGFDNTAAMVRSVDEFGTLTGEFDSELYRLYLFVDYNLINISTTTIMLLFLAYAVYMLRKQGFHRGDMYRFLVKGEALNPSIPKIMLLVLKFIVLLPYGMLGRKFMCDHILLTSAMMTLLAVIEHLLCHLEYNTQETPESLYELTHIMPVALPEEDKAEDEEKPEVYQEVAKSRADLLQSRFVHEMESGAYKEDDLSLQTMADRLGVSTRTLSNMVNGCFGIPFRDIVNKYRIEEAKRYMLAHPEATQSTVAFECGYKNDSVFNKKFKESEGVTPLMWITRNAASKDAE